MSNDILIRQLEIFINNGGTIEELRRILSICPNDEEFKDTLIISNNPIKVL